MVELLAPCGDMEKLRYALHYGADAVYLGGKAFSLRASSQNFDHDELREAVRLCHSLGKKIYITVNIFARSEHLGPLAKYFRFLSEIGVDGVIVSDPGVLCVLKENAPELKVSLSTQASTTNYKALQFWKDNGVDRVILARELSLAQIKEICAHKPQGMSVEVFVHGAMCISYSGRCLISSYLTGRDANLGDCAQPCRWNYALAEKTREGEYFPVEEDDKGTYFFNSKDLCLIEHISELIRAGVDSFKIEGRMKSIYYVASIVNAYRLAIDSALQNKPLLPDVLSEVSKVSHRAYTGAFFDGACGPEAQNYGTSSYIRTHDFVGVVRDFDASKGLIKLSQRNKFLVGDTLELLTPGKTGEDFVVEALYNEAFEPVADAPHADETLWLKPSRNLQFAPMDILRKKL